MIVDVRPKKPKETRHSVESQEIFSLRFVIGVYVAEQCGHNQDRSYKYLEHTLGIVTIMKLEDDFFQ